jgi:hypothetical protein
MTRGDRRYLAARERSGLSAIAYTRHFRVKHFQELVAMTLPHTNAGLMSRLARMRFALLYAPGCRSRARIQTGRVENCGE